MANQSADRVSRRAATSFGLESMESRVLLSAAGNYDGEARFFAWNRNQEQGNRDAEFHVSARRRGHDRSDGGYSFQSRDGDGRNDGRNDWERRGGPSNSPAVPPDYVFPLPWSRNNRPDPAPTPPITPSSNGNGNTIVEVSPVVTEAPRIKPESARAAAAEPEATAVSEASPTATASRMVANASAANASAPQGTSDTVLDWVKSGAIYAADVAGLSSSAVAVVEEIVPTAGAIVERMADPEQAVLSAAVNVVAAPAREFHIARLGSPLALMQDAIGSFIEQSVWPSTEQTIASPRRAWYITLTVLTLDAAVLTYYFQRRQKAKPVFAFTRRRPLMAAMQRFDE
jgi:hypothetical protein